MILRHERDKSSGRWNENTFLAIDERTGNELGRAEIIPEELSVMFPLRPLQVLLDLGNPPVPDRLLGAAVARAKKLCAESEQFCRLYAQLDPDDDELLDALMALGFIDNDGLVRMQMRLPTERDFPLPEGCGRGLRRPFQSAGAQILPSANESSVWNALWHGLAGQLYKSPKFSAHSDARG